MLVPIVDALRKIINGDYHYSYSLDEDGYFQFEKVDVSKCTICTSKSDKHVLEEKLLFKLYNLHSLDRSLERESISNDMYGYCSCIQDQDDCSQKTEITTPIGLDNELKHIVSRIKFIREKLKNIYDFSEVVENHRNITLKIDEINNFIKIYSTTSIFKCDNRSIALNDWKIKQHFIRDDSIIFRGIGNVINKDNFDYIHEYEHMIITFSPRFYIYVEEPIKDDTYLRNQTWSSFTSLIKTKKYLMLFEILHNFDFDLSDVPNSDIVYSNIVITKTNFSFYHNEQWHTIDKIDLITIQNRLNAFNAYFIDITFNDYRITFTRSNIYNIPYISPQLRIEIRFNDILSITTKIVLPYAPPTKY